MVAATAVEAAWAGGACIRVEERKKAKEATRMVNDRRSFGGIDVSFGRLFQIVIFYLMVVKLCWGPSSC